MVSGPLELSAVDLRALTGWPDPVIEDYLNLTRTMAETFEIVNIVNQTIYTIEGNSEAIVARLGRLEQQVDELANLGVNNASVGRIQKQVNEIAESVAGLGISPNNLQGKIKSLQQQIEDVAQSIPLAQIKLERRERLVGDEFSNRYTLVMA